MTAAVTWRREDAGSMPSMKAELHDPTRLSDDSSLLANETLDEGIILLPKGTRVTVTGNSRTKQSLVGRAGTVKKAIGLGGWHWLVLETGEEVKLQRNALSVVAVPSAVDPDTSEDDAKQNREGSTQVQHQVLTANEQNESQAQDPVVRTRPRRLPTTPTRQQPMDSATAQAISELMGQDREKQSSRINFLKLDWDALRRYQEFFGLTQCKETESKDKLAQAICQHFMSFEVDEQDVMGNFFQAAKRIRSTTF